ncbi:hypothetical protein MTIM_12580 [Mycobacterium timonense]|uniref:TetR family transcriptional regulator n=1 Tax=Mycobacterium timonense TaxID=701043 RepID=A0A7I9Z360_9MYCO|nr:hypothetical protein MTIM_12580 [Mycobacterium timonense]
MFRHFGSKAALFREALVLPFTDFVEKFRQTWQSVVPEETDEEELARRFVGQLYDVFVEHQGLLLTLMASETLSEEEKADAGIAEIRQAITALGQISAEGMHLRGLRSDHPDLPAHSTVAMIAGMAALRSTYFGRSRRRGRPSSTNSSRPSCTASCTGTAEQSNPPLHQRNCVMTDTSAIDLYYDPFDSAIDDDPTRCGSACAKKRRCTTTRSTTSTR